MPVKSLRPTPVAARQTSTNAAPEIPRQYESGPVKFAGDPNAFYKRRLVFDHVVDPKRATARERFEAVARALRDLLTQRWLKTDQTYDRGEPEAGVLLDERPPQVYLARHGETAWTISGQHTGLTDLPLTRRGEQDARRLGGRLKGLTFGEVFTSPLQRARRTAELAGFPVALVDPELTEWDYGRYEGLKTADIQKDRPDWDLFRDGGPGGESPAAVGARADRLIGRLRATAGDVLLFSSGHFLRVLAARWVGLNAAAGRHLVLGITALSVLGYEHNATQPVIRLWNDVSHVSA